MSVSLPLWVRQVPLFSMPPTENGAMDSLPNVPAMLDLLRISPRRLFPPGGAELYHQIGLLTGMSEGVEVLDVACGLGVSLEYFVREFGVQGFGVDIAPDLVEQAGKRSRTERIANKMQFQTGPSSALPYRDEIFDVTVGEIGLANHCDPEEAIAELVRVTKPTGFVVLVQLVWRAPVRESRKSALADYLGATPLMAVEWRHLLRESGIEKLHIEDWSDKKTAFRSAAVNPFPDFTKIFSFREKLEILRRTWQKWGWKGVRTGLVKKREVHRLLTRERILGLDLLKGRKAGGPLRLEPKQVSPGDIGLAVKPTGESEKSGSMKRPVMPAAPSVGSGDDGDHGNVTSDDVSSDTTGLPLFSPEEEQH